MLFLDDSTKNIEGTNNCNLKTIHVSKETDILSEIKKSLNCQE